MLFMLVFLAACSRPDTPPVTATDVTLFAPLPGQSMTVGYLSIANHSDATIRIDRVTSPQFGKVEIHATSYDGEVSRMRRLDELTIAPNDSVTLEPGGVHLMLMSPKADLDNVTLLFYANDAPVLTTTTRVKTR
jgi:copper(I)-binding protein